MNTGSVPRMRRTVMKTMFLTLPNLFLRTRLTVLCPRILSDLNPACVAVMSVALVCRALARLRGSGLDSSGLRVSHAAAQLSSSRRSSLCAGVAQEGAAGRGDAAAADGDSDTHAAGGHVRHAGDLDQLPASRQTLILLSRFSLSLSLSHTHTHTQHTHLSLSLSLSLLSLSLSHTDTHTHSYSYSLSHAHTHTHTHSYLSLSLPLSHTHKHTHSYSLSLSLSLSHTPNTHTHTLSLSLTTTHTHTHHTHHHVGFYGLRGLSIGVMVFILYKLYVLLPYTYPTPKLSPHRRRCISISPPKNLLCMIYKRFELWGL